MGIKEILVVIGSSVSLLSVPIISVVSCTRVLQDVTVRGNWVKSTQDLSVLSLTTACESEITQN